MTKDTKLFLVIVAGLVFGLLAWLANREHLDPADYPSCASITSAGVDMNARCDYHGKVVKFRDTPMGRNLSGVVE